MTKNQSYQVPIDDGNGRIEVIECDPSKAQLNPDCDQGHSYSYVNNDLNADKKLDNLPLLLPKLLQLRAQYQSMIEADQILASTISELLEGVCDNIKSEYLFAKLIMHLGQDTRAKLHLELLHEVQHIRDLYLTTY